MQTSTYSVPPTNDSTNRLMSEVALQCAIDIERYEKGSAGSLASLRQLADILDAGKIDDLTMVPVYDRALASEGTRVTSKAEMHSRLFEMTKRLADAENGTVPELGTIRDFCLSLHEALLNSRVETLFRSSLMR